MSTAQATVMWSLAWQGFRETGSNVQPFDGMVGHAQDLAWCATFRVAADASTGAPIPAGGGTAYTPSNYQAYKRAGLLLDLARDVPQPGDLFWVGYTSLARTRLLGIGHEARVVEHLGGTRVRTIEGNSNQAASNSGGEVASLVRDYAHVGSAHVVAFARPLWDGVTPQLKNLPTRADHTGQLIAVPPSTSVVAASRVPDGLSQLVVDGALGPLTVARWQRVLGGVGVDGELGPQTVRAVQQHLRAAGQRLGVDGVLGGETIRALQGYLGTPRDGVISRPDSLMVRKLQVRLNAGRF